MPRPFGYFAALTPAQVVETLFKQFEASMGYSTADAPTVRVDTDDLNDGLNWKGKKLRTAYTILQKYRLFLGNALFIKPFNCLSWSPNSGSVWSISCGGRQASYLYRPTVSQLPVPAGESKAVALR